MDFIPRIFCLSLIIYSCSILSCESIDAEKGRQVFEIFVREASGNPALVRPMAKNLFEKNNLMTKKILLNCFRPAHMCMPIFPIPFLDSLYKEVALFQAQRFALAFRML